MDASLTSFDWNHLRAFLAVAEAGSYSAAARALRLAQPTVGRQVAALEQQLGVVLLERAGRGVALSPTGLALVEHVRAMSEAALRVARVAAGQSLALEGPVCLTASELLAAYVLPPLLVRLRARYPGIELEIVASNQPQDLRRREADIALRNFRPSDPELIARKLREDEAHLYATPSYLRGLGRRVTAASLAGASFLGFDREPRFREGLSAWLGVTLAPAQFSVVSASQHVQWALVCEGAGVGLMLSSIGDAEPRVRRVLPGFPPLVVPTWLVTHREVHTSRRVRAVADALAEGLAGGAKSTRRASRGH